MDHHYLSRNPLPTFFDPLLQCFGKTPTEMVDATTIDASDPIIIEFQSSLGNVFGDISSPFGSSEPIFGRRLS